MVLCFYTLNNAGLNTTECWVNIRQSICKVVFNQQLGYIFKQNQNELYCQECYTFEEFVLVTEAPQCNRLTVTRQDTDNKNYKKSNMQIQNRQCTK